KMFKFHVAHIHIHQGRAGKEIITFRRNHRDLMLRKLAHMPGGRDACYSVTYDHYMFHSYFIFLKIRYKSIIVRSAITTAIRKRGQLEKFIFFKTFQKLLPLFQREVD